MPPHTPDTHASPARHAVLHVPQWLASLRKSTHESSHKNKPGAQAHSPSGVVCQPPPWTSAHMSGGGRSTTSAVAVPRDVVTAVVPVPDAPPPVPSPPSGQPPAAIAVTSARQVSPRAEPSRAEHVSRHANRHEEHLPARPYPTGAVAGNEKMQPTPDYISATAPSGGRRAAQTFDSDATWPRGWRSAEPR